MACRAKVKVKVSIWM